MSAKYNHKGMDPEDEYSFGSTDHMVKNGDSSVINLSTTSSKGKKGWFVTPAGAFIIVLAALLLAAIVGLIVGLEHPDRGKVCPIFPETTTTASTTTGTTLSTTTDGISLFLYLFS